MLSREEIANMATVSVHLTQQNMGALARSTVALRQTMAELTTSFLKEHAQDPLLVSFSSDPSSLLVHMSATDKIGEVTFTRSGRQLLEVLLQRVTYKVSNYSNQWRMHIELGFPLPLSLGKSAGNLFRAASALFGLPRRKGHASIIVTHLCFDRAVHTALESLLWGRLEAYYATQAGQDFPDLHELYHLMELFVSSPCAAHAAQNSLKWAVAPFLCKDALHHLHVGIEACRNSFTMLSNHLFDFLIAHLRFREHAHDVQDAGILWAAVGVDASLLGRLAEVHPVWTGEVLLVAASLEGTPDVLGQVSTLLLYLWRWRPSCSDYHLHGFQNVTPPVKTCAVVIGLSSWVAESFLHLIMDDDRLALYAKDAWQSCEEEFDYLVSLSDGTWQALTQMVSDPDLTITHLRDAVLTAALISLGFLHATVFEAFDRFPWSLALGDSTKQLERLADASLDTLQDSFSRRLRGLLDRGYDQAMLLKAISLLQQASWSTMGVEQQHGSCAAMHKKHPTFGPETLLQRSFLHTYRHVLQPPRDSARVRRAQAAQTLPQQAGTHITARNVFVQELFSETMTVRRQAGLEHLDQSTCRSLMTRANKMYTTLSPAEQEKYAQRARAAAAQKVQSLEEEAEVARQFLHLNAAREQQEKDSQGVRNILSDSTTKDQIWELMAVHLSDSRSTVAEAKEAVQRDLKSPEPLTAGQQEQLLGFEEAMGRPELPARPAWLKTLCLHRDALQGSVFLVHLDEDEQKVWLFLYAKQNPREMGLVELQPEPLPNVEDFPQPWSVDTFADFGAESFLLKRPLTFAMATMETFPESAKVEVITDAWFSAGYRLVTHRTPQSLESLLEEFPEEQKASLEESGGRSKRKTMSGLPEYLLQNHPWLRDFAARGFGKRQRGPIAKASGASESAASSSAVGANRAPPLAPEEEEATWEALRRLRQQWKDDAPVAADNFQISLRGGAWTKANRGTEADCVSVAATRGPPWAWCEKFKLPKMSRYTLGYGTHVANRLASEWSMKMQFFYSMYIAANDETFTYSEAQLDSYVPDPEWQQFKAGLADKKALARANGIDELRPINP